MTATLLVIASAALHAAWNALLKRHPSPRLAGALILIIASLAASVPAVLAPEVAFPSRASFVWTLAAGLGEAAYFVTLARALDAAPLGVAYTITRGGSIVLVWPLSVLFFHERAGTWAILGVVAVVLGLALTGFAPAPRKEGAEGGARAGVAWAAVCAVFIALVYIFYKQALTLGSSRTALFAVSLLVAAPLNVLALGRGAPQRLVAAMKATPGTLLVAGLVCTASFLLFLGALHDSGAGRVLTLRNTSVVFAHAFAWLGGVSAPRPVLVGGVLVVLGAVLLGGG